MNRRRLVQSLVFAVLASLAVISWHVHVNWLPLQYALLPVDTDKVQNQAFRKFLDNRVYGPGHTSPLRPSKQAYRGTSERNPPSAFGLRLLFWRVGLEGSHTSEALLSYAVAYDRPQAAAALLKVSPHLQKCVGSFFRWPSHGYPDDWPTERVIAAMDPFLTADTFGISDIGRLSPDALEFFIAKLGPNAILDDGKTMLFTAKHAWQIEALLRAGADPVARTPHGMTLLHVLTENNFGQDPGEGTRSSSFCSRPERTRAASRTAAGRPWNYSWKNTGIIG